MFKCVNLKFYAEFVKFFQHHFLVVHLVVDWFDSIVQLEFKPFLNCVFLWITCFLWRSFVIKWNNNFFWFNSKIIIISDLESSQCELKSMWKSWLLLASFYLMFIIIQLFTKIKSFSHSTSSHPIQHQLKHYFYYYFPLLFFLFSSLNSLIFSIFCFLSIFMSASLFVDHNDFS